MRQIILILPLALAGCGQADPPAASTNNAEATTNPPAEAPITDATKAKAVAAKDELFKQLSGRLMEVMKSDGPAAAIEVCSKEASQFATSVSEEQGVKIGRTALKLRNSKNVPPAWAGDLATKDAVDPQFVSIDEQTVGALLPIKLQQKCLTCHGEQDSLAPEVREQLAAHYPDDEATGFKEGDLRGWFWVEVSK